MLFTLFLEVSIKIENKSVNSLSMPRPCRAVDVEREHKPVTTYTIEGAYYNRASFLLGEKYKINENSENNNGSLLNTSHTTLGDISFYTEPLSSKSLLTLNNDHKLSPTLTSRNVPTPPDTIFNTVDRRKMMMNYELFSLSSSIHENTPAVPNTTRNHIRSNDPYAASRLSNQMDKSDAPGTISNAVDRRKMMMNYDLLSLSPSIHENTPAVPNATQNHIYNNDHHPASKLSIQENTSGAPATITNTIYSDNIQQPMDSLHSTLTSQSALLASRHPPSNNDLTDPNIHQVKTARRKYPRWAVRLSQPKQIHTPSLSSSRPLSRERPRTALSSSTRSTRTIPRYAVYYED